jgi:PleD family two-component response regulator
VSTSQTACENGAVRELQEDLQSETSQMQQGPVQWNTTEMYEPQRKRILVVDDDRDVREALFTILADTGFQVLTAESFGE